MSCVLSRSLQVTRSVSAIVYDIWFDRPKPKLGNQTSTNDITSFQDLAFQETCVRKIQVLVCARLAVRVCVRRGSVGKCGG